LGKPKAIDCPFGKLQVDHVEVTLASTNSTRGETSTQLEHIPTLENEETTVDVVEMSIGSPFGKVQLPVLQIPI
jgi:hypothetical protein